MKKYKIISMLLVLAFLGSCKSDFLDTELLTQKVAENYYSTPEEIQEALVGCYDGLQIISKQENWYSFFLLSENLSDNCFGGFAPQDTRFTAAIDHYDFSIAPGRVDDLNDLWIYYYKAINRCNTLIENIGNADLGNDESLKPGYEAEARFIRAYLYFDLARIFGTVPLVLNNVDALKNLPRSSPELLYKAIADDLTFASENGQSNTLINDAANNGHVNKWAAKALLARVYMFYTGYYNKPDLEGVTKETVLKGLEDLIALNEYGLIDNFFDLWPAAATYQAAKNGKPIAENTYVGEGNKETVFAIKYTYTSAEDVDGNEWLAMTGIREQVTKQYGYDTGWGANTVVPKLYNDFESGDERRDASIIGMDEEGIAYRGADICDYTGYFIKKYHTLCDSSGKNIGAQLGVADFMRSGYQDYIIIRYSDVLLMAAELGSPNGQNYLDQVRNRAGLSSKPLTTENLREERRFEFALEGIRFWDLLRYDYTLDYAANAVTIRTTVKTSGEEVEMYIDGSRLKITRGLTRIPETQITLSDGVLTQNPGWE